MQQETRIALAGMAVLAVALGIGRFALTPLLPLMQTDAGIGLVTGGWLASSSMFGYLAGALLCALLPMHPREALRGGLALVIIATLGMGLTVSVPGWLLLRFAGGVASAALIVHGIAWSMGLLRAAGRPEMEGVVFSGTGVGIVLSGLAVAGLQPLGVTSAQFWVGFGVLCATAATFIWQIAGMPAPSAPAAAVRTGPAPSGPAWALAAMYGLLGFAYVIPATFLPLIAEEQLHLPALREWFWPLFGGATALATLALPWLPARIGNRTALAACCVSMLLGMLLCVVSPSVPGLCIGTIMIGSVTMPVVMLVMREARLLAPRNPTRLIATLTTTFGIGQGIGPLAGAWLAERGDGFALPILAAAAVSGIALGFALLRTSPSRARLRVRHCPCH